MYISLFFQTKHFLPSSSVFPHNCCLTRILSISRTFCGRMLKGQKKVFCDVVSICPLNMVNKTMASLLKQPQQPRFIQKKLSSEMCAIAAVKASAKKMPYYRTRDRLFGLGTIFCEWFGKSNQWGRCHHNEYSSLWFCWWRHYCLQ